MFVQHSNCGTVPFKGWHGLTARRSGTDTTVGRHGAAAGMARGSGFPDGGHRFFAFPPFIMEPIRKAHASLALANWMPPPTFGCPPPPRHRRSNIQSNVFLSIPPLANEAAAGQRLSLGKKANVCVRVCVCVCLCVCVCRCVTPLTPLTPLTPP